MGFAVGLHSFVVPPCIAIGNSAPSALIAPSFQAASGPATRTATLDAHSIDAHDGLRVKFTPLKPIATALQQKVSD
jgi:hypothetical protein